MSILGSGNLGATNFGPCLFLCEFFGTFGAPNGFVGYISEIWLTNLTFCPLDFI